MDIWLAILSAMWHFYSQDCMSAVGVSKLVGFKPLRPVAAAKQRGPWSFRTAAMRHLSAVGARDDAPSEAGHLERLGRGVHHNNGVWREVAAIAACGQGHLGAGWQALRHGTRPSPCPGWTRMLDFLRIPAACAPGTVHTPCEIRCGPPGEDVRRFSEPGFEASRLAAAA